MLERVAKIPVAFTVNGDAVQVRTWPMMRLLDVLREELRDTGTKEGCGEGECGACSVLIDGKLVNSCLVPIAQVAGADVRTIEGVFADPRFPAVRDAFVRCNAAQCGICTPGMILATLALLAEHARPTEAQVREALAGNLCRCTGYVRIFEAVREGAAGCCAGASAGGAGHSGGGSAGGSAHPGASHDGAGGSSPAGGSDRTGGAPASGGGAPA